MRFEYISSEGNIEAFDHDLKEPMRSEDFLYSLPKYFQGYSIVLSGKLITSKDFIIAPHHKIWLIKKSAVDIKMWRRERVKGGLVVVNGPSRI